MKGQLDCDLVGQSAEDASLNRRSFFVKAYCTWFRWKRQAFDSKRLRGFVEFVGVVSYLTFFLQSSLSVGAGIKLAWSYWMNLAVVALFVLTYTVSRCLPAREQRPKVADVHQLRELERRLRNLQDALEIHSGLPELIKTHGKHFHEQAFRAACEAVCAGRDIRVTFMTESDDETLRISSYYPPDEQDSVGPATVIPLTDHHQRMRCPKEAVGVGGYAYGACRTVYVPSTRARAAYVVKPDSMGEVIYRFSRLCVEAQQETSRIQVSNLSSCLRNGKGTKASAWRLELREPAWRFIWVC